MFHRYAGIAIAREPHVLVYLDDFTHMRLPSVFLFFLFKGKKTLLEKKKIKNAWKTHMWKS